MPGKTDYARINPFITRDGSEIRELMHPQHHAGQHGVHNQSLAEARIPAGTTTLLHRHLESEELYHITQGEGLMTLGNEQFQVNPGDTVCIPPGTAHCIANTADTDLVILCCCAPPYSDMDTELL